MNAVWIELSVTLPRYQYTGTKATARNNARFLERLNKCILIGARDNDVVWRDADLTTIASLAKEDTARGCVYIAGLGVNEYGTLSWNEK